MLANCHYLNRHGVLQGLQTICGLKTLTRIVSFFELILKISIIDAHLLRSWIFQCDPTPAPDIQTFREMGGMENLRWEQVSLIVGHQFNDHIILMWSQEEHKGRKISKLPSPWQSLVGHLTHSYLKPDETDYNMQDLCCDQMLSPFSISLFCQVPGVTWE